ncbi:MAG: endolytic transglycosylase MltG [Candidatus Doudnabacteria bacterium]|nr:endolytic transglycosylase MltG [Candidatus Doudnabacteria bacterium]
MKIPVSKKNLVVLGTIITILAVSLIFSYRQDSQKKRLTYQQQAKNQKAEEITIRIIEGWSNREIAEYLEKQGIVSSADFLKAVKNFDTTDFDNFLPKKAAGDLQGFLYPDTYRLFMSITDRTITKADDAAKTIIAKLLDTFVKRLPVNGGVQAKKQGLDLYQAIILASILENETGRNAISIDDRKRLDEERKIVAGIFYNRLHSNIALQSDATINYITSKKDPAPALEDLQIASPYNTYKNRGLPPSPIGNPSLSSINAVLNPAKTDYFYFLHKQPSGEPVYSKTFEEHVKNKQKYLK